MQDENVPVLSPDFLNTKLYDPKGYTQVPDDVLPLQATATRFPVPEDEKYLYPLRSKTLGSAKASAAASPSRSKTTVKVEPFGLTLALEMRTKQNTQKVGIPRVFWIAAYQQFVGTEDE